jgi:hypothetical protein
MKDLTTISTDLFNKVRSRFSDIKLGDAQGAVITDPSNARFFDLNYKIEDRELGHVNIKIDEKSITVIYNESMTEGQNAIVKRDWYAFLKELRMFAKSNMLTFDTRDITKSNLDKRDYEYLAQENGDQNMSESKLFGTSKTSFQDIGQAKIIVRHSQPVNYNVPAGRTMHIESIYIESSEGERFRYPTRHLNGARALAMHVANGGTSYDTIGQHIIGLSEELSKLRQFKNYTQRNGLSEALSDVSERVLSRIDTIKEQISKLQRQSYYADFKESFEPNQEMPIPEETVNQWVDALTIRTFNEELKSVFPYIYRLVDQPKELAYEDLVDEAEEVCDACEKAPCECDELEEHNHLEDYEQHLDNITTFDYDVQEDEVTSYEDNIQASEGNAFAQAVAKAKAAGMKPGDKFSVGGTEYTLKDAIEMAGLSLENFYSAEELEQPQQQQQPQLVNREVVEFIKSMYDAETGTFPKGEEGVKIAVEKRFGDDAGKFADFVIEKLSVKTQAEQPLEQAQQESPELSAIRRLAGM